MKKPSVKKPKKVRGEKPKETAHRAMAEKPGYPAIPYTAVKQDVIAAASPLVVSQVALAKVGPRYLGLLDVGGDYYRFRLSGEGFLVHPVPSVERPAAQLEFHRMLDAEQAVAFQEERRRSL